MAATDEVMAGLEAAAGAIDAIEREEASRRISEGVSLIRALRDRIQRWPAANVRDAVTGLEAVAAATGWSAEDRTLARSALLDAAMMIRDLKDVAETGTKVQTMTEETSEP